MSKMIKKSELTNNKWYNIKLGSCIVTYCNECNAQRTHHCVDIVRIGEGTMCVFLCDYCRFNNEN